MRDQDETPQPRTGSAGETGNVQTLGQTSGQTPTARPVVPRQPTVGGKHRAATTPVIPAQKAPPRQAPPAPSAPVQSAPVETAAVTPVDSPIVDSPIVDSPVVDSPVVDSPVVDSPVVESPVAESPVVESSIDSPVEAPQASAPVPTVAPEAEAEAAPVPHTARWRASHGPRMLAGVLLVLAVGGTSALGLDYQQHPGNDQLLSLVIGIIVVVGLWAMLIASTPQVVSLRGSVLTIHNSSGTERFDLADGLQPVDVVGEPHSSKWALVLHRDNRTSLVLRRRDVDAVQLDPIVRHYRAIAHRKYSERQARFSR